MPLSRKRDHPPAGFEPAYDSGSSANDMRFGVDAPLVLPLLLRETATAKMLGTWSTEEGGVGDMGVGGAERFLSEEWRGGDGARVDEEWRGFVKRRETETVEVEVPATGVTEGGERKAGRGARVCAIGAGAWRSRIWRRDSTVRSAWKLEDEDEPEESY